MLCNLMKKHKNISMSPEVNFDKNDAQFLQRIIELNFNGPRCQSAIILFLRSIIRNHNG